jgi:hypothetical protein
MSRNRRVPLVFLVILLLALPAVAAGPPAALGAGVAGVPAWNEVIALVQAWLARLLPAPGGGVAARPGAAPANVCGSDPDGHCLPPAAPRGGVPAKPGAVPANVCGTDPNGGCT